MEGRLAKRSNAIETASEPPPSTSAPTSPSPSVKPKGDTLIVATDAADAAFPICASTPKAPAEQAAAIAASRTRTASQSTAIAATSLLGIRLSRRSIALAQASSTKKSANDAPPAYAGALPRTTDTLIGLSFCRSTAT